MREIKFRAEYKGQSIEVATIDKPIDGRGAHNFRGYEKNGGYILRRVANHPLANKRGYYPEHRLVVEASIGRFLLPDEVVHHIDGDRSNNGMSNLKIITQSEHVGIEHRGKRNPNGTIASADPIFETIKFRLYDTDRGVTQIYTLSKLINTTFRRGKFQFRGRWTGLLDKNKKEVTEGDILLIPDIYRAQTEDGSLGPEEPFNHLARVVYQDGSFGVIIKKYGKYLRPGFYSFGQLMDEGVFCDIQTVGDIYSNPELL